VSQTSDDSIFARWFSAYRWHWLQIGYPDYLSVIVRREYQTSCLPLTVLFTEHYLGPPQGKPLRSPALLIFNINA